MKNLLKKLQIVTDESDGSPRPSLSLPAWLGSIPGRGPDRSATPSSSASSSSSSSTSTSTSTFAASAPAATEEEEDYQIQMAMELSAREDPEAVQIEVVKQISLGEVPADSTPSEVAAFRYWNYNVLSYGDKIPDGFYDLYGNLPGSAPTKMPSLVNLQETPVSDSICWEAVLVDRPGDADLLKLEKKALKMALESRVGTLDYINSFLHRFSVLVANYMGGPVDDDEKILNAWRSHSNYLRRSLGTNVLPLGLLTVGLARHRALLFKVLADCVGISCQLVRGELRTGSSDGAMNIVKLNDGRECIVDLMADPGTLIPCDAEGMNNINASLVPMAGAVQNSSSNDTPKKSFIVDSCVTPGRNEGLPSKPMDEKMKKLRSSVGLLPVKSEDGNSSSYVDVEASCSNSSNLGKNANLRSNHHSTLARSPPWTEGTNLTKIHKKKVKDVSKYMMDATKENPNLAKKIHDVLLESGVAVPPDLFSEISSQQQETEMSKDIVPYKHLKDLKTGKNDSNAKSSDSYYAETVSPCLPDNILKPEIIPSSSTSWNEHPNPVCCEAINSSITEESPIIPCSSQLEESSVQPRDSQIDSMPVSAAVATAAIVASSMVVTVAKSTTGPRTETATAVTASAAAAAALIATTAVTKQQQQLQSVAPLPAITDNTAFAQDKCETKCDIEQREFKPLQDDPHKRDKVGIQNQETERTSDKSVGSESEKSSGSEKSYVSHDDVGELEIAWEEIILGDRIGLGSYGEVYRGDWHGTEVAAKRFLDQDISGDALEEFKSEVRIMKRLRHPNVVLLMGAVTHVPNLSIVTEFLPRGSLYRLIHRPNNQLDERRRLKMALDVVRGMNYLHTRSPVIVHRDLKSPNLLVDKNWVVKVCDFGLSRAKQSTFLSSKSTAGTAEWMAPELLRDEPSDEKCDIYSFGVILWELCTLQQPWKGMNPMQVVGAVGFQHRRLKVPKDIDPSIAEIIMKCWQDEPRERPSFSEILAWLKPLQKLTSTNQSTKQ